MTKPNDDVFSRAQSVLISDKSANMELVKRVLASDVTELLSSFMTLVPDSVRVDILVSGDGQIELKICALADALIKTGAVI